MRNLGIIFSLIMSAQLPALAEKELPQDIRTLADKRAEAIERIDRSFVAELEKLKTKYTKLGDLDNANAIVALIEKANAKMVRDSLNRGQWNYVNAEGKISAIRSFDGDFLLPETGGRCAYTIGDGLIRINWGDGKFEELKIDPLNLDSFKGVNHLGDTFRYAYKN